MVEENQISIIHVNEANISWMNKILILKTYFLGFS